MTSSHSIQKTCFLLTWLLCGALWSQQRASAQAVDAPLPVTSIPLPAAISSHIVQMDIDRDGLPELILTLRQTGVKVIGKKLNWEASLPVGTGTPTLGDIDNNGTLELLVPYQSERSAPGQQMSELAIFSAKEGKKLLSWSLPGHVSTGLVLRDLDGDKRLETIMVTDQGGLLVYTARGEDRTGFPQPIAAAVKEANTILPTPVVGELDGNRDNGLEIAVATHEGRVMVFHNDGKQLPSFPVDLKEPIAASPVIGDFDGDGKGELLVVTTKGKVALIRMDGRFFEGFPKALGEEVTATPLVVDLDRDGQIECVIATRKGTLHNINTQGEDRLGWPRQIAGGVQAAPLAADLDGDSKTEVLVATESGNLYAFTAAGGLLPGYPKLLGVSITQTPTFAAWEASPETLNADSNRRWLIPTGSGELLMVGAHQKIASWIRGNTWLQFQGSAAHTGSLDNVTHPQPLLPEDEPISQQQTTQPEPQMTQGMGCNTSGHTNGSWGGLWMILVGLLFVSLRRKGRQSQK